MIAVVLYSLLFILGLIYTLVSPTKKLLAPWLNSLHDRKPIKPAAAPIGGLRGVFATFDKNKDGFITKQELRESLQNMGILAGEKDVEDMVEKVDFNGDGLIDFGEFCKLYESMDGGGAAADEDGDLRDAFDVFDGNKDGRITVEELGMVLSSLGFSEGSKIEDCKEMIRKVDVDGDGMVDFEEFKKMMREGLGRLIAVS
ncbi:calmodulin-like protein 3 [Salvia divinorum]|uniref:Calmodulin-like protein 3 n=1 Tax=Salvia divinorum TaxID=28513 RepID=A0ABD1HEH0_SALDI